MPCGSKTLRYGSQIAIKFVRAQSVRSIAVFRVTASDSWNGVEIFLFLPACRQYLSEVRSVTSNDTPDPALSGQDQGRDQAGRFTKGRSGNLAGKPRGARDRATLAAEALLGVEAKALTRKAIELALKGDVQALRICLDRILPTRRGRPVQVPLPEINAASDVTAALSAVMAAISRGELTTDEAGGIATVVEAARKSIELVEIAARVAALEARRNT
jgi:hypothetical protein